MYSVRIRNIEKSAVPSTKPTMFAAVSVCSRKIENGTSGSFTRRSQPMKRDSSSADDGERRRSSFRRPSPNRSPA